MTGSLGSGSRFSWASGGEGSRSPLGGGVLALGSPLVEYPPLEGEE